MSKKLVLEILLVILGLFSDQTLVAIATPRYAKPNCKEKCGNLTIPFPFGIGTGCFLDEWYEIDCQENDTLPILKKTKLEVLNISIGGIYAGDGRQVITVNLPTFDSNSTNCTGNRDNVPFSLEGSQFYFSQERNIFTAIGCNVLSVMDQTQSAVIGCKSKCAANVSSIYSDCSGVDDCCNSTITGNSQNFGPGFSREIMRESVDDQECKYAFLMDSSWLNNRSQINLSALKLASHVPAVLQWGIPSKADIGIYLYDNYITESDSYRCDDFTPPGSVRCYCVLGYRGNPYLINGCEDIDECEEGHSSCSGGCVNKRGGYHCVDRARTIKLVAIGIGAGLGALILIYSLWYLWHFILRRKEAKKKEGFFRKNGGLLLQQQLSSFEGNLEKSKIFSSIELEKATDNFSSSRLLGKGGQGTVYKGMLANGSIVAIKKAITIDDGNIENFINEVAILSQINHRNVVNLIGCCLETEVPLLVYEFIPNGTLSEYLHNNANFFISWDMRLRIACDVAGALAYLHSAASMPIYHRDIKSSNIMLDEKYRAKVADFGTSRFVSLEQTHVTTIIQGTFGYLDPEFFRSCQFTDKSDVYSFGVVLVELLTGRRPVNPLLEDETQGLAMHFIQSMEEDRLFDILDAQVLKQARKEHIVSVANLAKRCLNLKGRKRPPMREVALELEGVRKLEHPSNIQQSEGVHVKNKHCIDYSNSRPFEMEADVVSLDVQPLFPSNSLQL